MIISIMTLSRGGSQIGHCGLHVGLLVLVMSCIIQQSRGITDYACNFEQNADLRSMSFCDTSLSDDVRVKDLVSRLTLEEKVGQLGNSAAGVSRLGIPAYQWWQEGLHGVAHVNFGGALQHATSFPLPILTTASFNKLLWNQIGQESNGVERNLGSKLVSGKFSSDRDSVVYSMSAEFTPHPYLLELPERLCDHDSTHLLVNVLALQFYSPYIHIDIHHGTPLSEALPGIYTFPSYQEAVSTEARAFYNEGIAGLTYWSPVINIVRDPRWGRVQETSGEDPAVTSSYATYFVRGMQEGESSGKADSTARVGANALVSGPARLKLSACCKHFTAYDIDKWQGIDRYHFNAKVTEQDLVDTYNPPFKSCVQDGRSSSLMCSYNKVNGVPTCADYDFLTGTVRNTWGLDGYIVSDCDSVMIMHEATNYAVTTQDAVADALNAGLDLNCGDYLATYTESAIKIGKVEESKVDMALSNLFAVQMRLGMFDGNPANQAYGSLGVNDVCSSAHQELAVEAARQGIVLLKNEGDTLPLSPSKTLAVIGPNANATHVMLGNYEGIPCQYVTPLQGLVQFGSGDYNKVLYSQGCINTACEHNDFIGAAVSTASKTDAVILVMGLSQVQESEALDRTTLLLPGHQQDLVNQVAGAAAGRPVVLVIMCAGPLDISFAKADSRIQSILWVGYPGQAGGQAIAEVIFGHHNPGGKLPVSWYPEEYTKIDMGNMWMRPEASSGYPGRTYRFYTGETIYDFGYGLSYTTFTHSFALAPSSVTAPSLQAQLSEANAGACAISNFDVHVKVENSGTVGGRHSVLLFSKPPTAGMNGNPLKQLVAFESMHVEAGQHQNVVFNIDPCQHLGTVKEDGTHSVDAGTHILLAGDAIHSLALVASSAVTEYALPGG